MAYKLKKFDVIIQAEIYAEDGTRHGYYPLTIRVKAKTAKNAASVVERRLKSLKES
jgi:hypothetical protein